MINKKSVFFLIRERYCYFYYIKRGKNLKKRKENIIYVVYLVNFKCLNIYILEKNFKFFIVFNYVYFLLYVCFFFVSDTCFIVYLFYY